MIDKTKQIQAISPEDLLVYLCLRRYKNSNTGESTVPIEKLTELTSTSPVTVLNSIDRLKETGHLTCIKKGRVNYYKLLSNINAKSFAFMDESISRKEKVLCAVKEAFVEDEGNAENNTDRYYDYMVRIEEQVVTLQKQVNYLATELDRARKYLSVISGQEYNPLTLP